MGDLDIPVGDSLEGGRALQRLPIREAGDLTNGRDVDFSTDGRVLGAGVPNRQARSAILCRIRAHVTARSHAFTFRPMALVPERVCVSTPYSGAMVDQVSGTDARAGQNLDRDVSTPTVFIATPMYGGMAAGIYTVSMVQLPAVFLRNRVDSLYAFTSSESLVPNARNVLTHQFLESTATHLMWIDSDIGFNAMDIVSMLIADRDIVCGIYPKKEVDWARVAQAVNAGVPAEELSNHAGLFAIQLLDDSADGLVADPDGLLEVAAAGTGFMLIKRGVFDTLSAVVPEYAPDRAPIKEYYATTTEPESGRLITEDYHFCKLARSHGYKIYAAPWVRLSHAGTYVFERQFDVNWLKLSDQSEIDTSG
jgi:hypothetical protein